MWNPTRQCSNDVLGLFDCFSFKKQQNLGQYDQYGSFYRQNLGEKKYSDTEQVATMRELFNGEMANPHIK
jgi:hypothetical protein